MFVSGTVRAARAVLLHQRDLHAALRNPRAPDCSLATLVRIGVAYHF
jgi:hypothetical protein